MNLHQLAASFKLHLKVTEKQRVFICEILIVRYLDDVRVLQKFQILERTFELIHVCACQWVELLLYQVILPQIKLILRTWIALRS